MADDRFLHWIAGLEERHLGDLTFQEVRHGLQALSSLYVERRERLAESGALEGSGKRAAFALFYGPLHFLVTRRIVRELGAASPAPEHIVDLGCGTGASGAAWAIEAGGRPQLTGVDANRWAVAEARWTWSRLGLAGAVHRGQVERTRLLPPPAALLLAYTANELSDKAREKLLDRLIEAGSAGQLVLILEPIARGVVPWWDEYEGRVRAAGGRSDAWRFPVDLPARLKLLDRAAGLDHRELTARSLYFGPRPAA